MPRDPGRRWGMTTAILALVLMIGCATAPRPEAVQSLDVKIRTFGPDMLKVTNVGDVPIYDCEVTINDTFVAPWEGADPQEETDVNLYDALAPDGERFTAVSRGINDVLVVCDSSTGQREATYGKVGL